MRIKKYRPNFCEGFEDEYFEVSTKKELLESKLCSGWINDGFKIAFSKDSRFGHIMAIRNEPKLEWWVVAIITNDEDSEILKSWLYDFNELREYNDNEQRNSI